MTYEHLFPTRDGIPAEHRLDPYPADRYLVDGELRQWAGPTETAYGAVFVRTGGGLERPPPACPAITPVPGRTPEGRP